MNTVGQWIEKRNLSPDGYDPINDDQEIERELHTPSGDEMIVFGTGTGRIINPIGSAGSIYESGDIEDYLVLENNQDWEKKP